jgi:molecular chaperone IbpA
MLDTVSRSERNQPSYPPYNIELTGEDRYCISMAVAGFDRSELDVETEHNTLTISGNKAAAGDENAKTFLHRGIAARDFKRQFQLADHVRVIDAKLENGLLHVHLVKEIPEAMKPRRIAIESDENRAIEAEKSAA